MKKGKIILIEGTDGSGKNTQAHLLLVRLNREGIPCKLMSFPRYHTPTGRIVGQSYLGKEREYWSGESGWFLDADATDPKIASLYYAADRRAAVKDILKIINSGQNLILDRYYISNMAHQGGKLETTEEREQMFKWIETLELDLLDIPKEDLTIFLHMPLNVSSRLRQKRENITSEILDGHEENVSHIKRAEETYLQLAKRSNWKTIECAPGNTFDSLKNPGTIHEEVYEIVKNFFTPNFSKKQEKHNEIKKIYFSASVRGGRENAESFAFITSELKKYGEVLTENIGRIDLSEEGEDNISDKRIHDRNLTLIDESDFFVAEITSPSIGVGYEISYALSKEKPILCLYKNQSEKKISAIISGSGDINKKFYSNLEEIKEALKIFFNNNNLYIQ